MLLSVVTQIRVEAIHELPLLSEANHTPFSATPFCFCLALVTYNILATVRTFIGCISILQGRSISADNLLAIARDLMPKCFAPTNIFAKMRCTPVIAIHGVGKIEAGLSDYYMVDEI